MVGEPLGWGISLPMTLGEVIPPKTNPWGYNLISSQLNSGHLYKSVCDIVQK